MSNIASLDHEIMLLPLTGGILCGHQMSLRNWVIIKVAERAWLPPCVVLVINDNLYGLMCALSYICSVGP